MLVMVLLMLTVTLRMHPETTGHSAGCFFVFVFDSLTISKLLRMKSCCACVFWSFAYRICFLFFFAQDSADSFALLDNSHGKGMDGFATPRLSVPRPGGHRAGFQPVVVAHGAAVSLPAWVPAHVGARFRGAQEVDTFGFPRSPADGFPERLAPCPGQAV